MKDVDPILLLLDAMIRKTAERQSDRGVRIMLIKLVDELIQDLLAYRSSLDGTSVVHIDKMLAEGKTMDEIQMAVTLKCLKLKKDNVTQTAKALGIGRATMYRWLDKVEEAST